RYFKYRGNYDNSKIVKRYSLGNINNWQDLLENSEDDIHELLKYWDDVKSLKEGNHVNEKAEEYKLFRKHPLNQILYGPPGTGKTFTLQNEYFERFTVRESSLSRKQFLENMIADKTWWQVLSMAVLDLNSAKVEDILNHE